MTDPSAMNLVVFYCIFACTLFWYCQCNAQDLSDSTKPFHCNALDPDNYTCASCLHLDSRCAWCASEGFDAKNKRSRCDTFDSLEKANCQQIQFPVSRLTLLQDKPLSNAYDEREGLDATELRPQRIRLQLRAKEEYTFTLQFRQALRYPLDLYYLMDMSYSMKDDRDELSKLGDSLAQSMKTITNNFQLGFGSFVDKRVMPFADVRPGKGTEYCGNERCVPPYGFINQLSLTKDTSLFARKVAAANLSKNIDEPEGGFDALVQALACKHQIGWRPSSRKMIVLSTDAPFHHALDGRIAGIIKPNDGQCHLNRNGVYTESTHQDYPSIGLVHHMIQESKANLIFAVTSEVFPLYKHLQNALPNTATSVGELAGDSSNVVKLIRDEYAKISEKIIMVDTATDPVRVTYKTPCKGNIWQETNVCEGVKKMQDVEFNVTIQVTECSHQRNFKFNIGPSALADVLHVDLEVVCDCDCDKEARKSDARCNDKGDFICGVCECYGPNRGRRCECNATGVSNREMDDQCRLGGDPKAPLCEGRGTCECGTCVCDKRANPSEVFSGLFCECDNFNCPRSNRLLCNGQGTCECGECVCNDGWTGRACECSTNQAACMASTGKICNGVGFCQCGACKCFQSEEGMRYSGPTCEDCPTCPQRCQILEPCVQCKMFHTGSYEEEKCKEVCATSIIPVKELPEVNKTSLKCQAIDRTDDCTFYWVYEEIDDKVNVWALERKRCPTPVNPFWVIGGVVAAIVLIGLLLLLIWRLFAWWYDRREYRKFMEETKRSQWQTNQNPIYVPATTTIKNPQYGQEMSFRN